MNYNFRNDPVVRIGREAGAVMKTIRVLRQARGWTQFELALKVGVQPQAVYLWESGRRTPQVPQLRRLGALFGLCSDEIALEPARDADRAPHGPPPTKTTLSPGSVERRSSPR